MAIVKTYIRVPSQEAQFVIPGDYTAAQLQTMYNGQIAGLQNMVGTEEIVTGSTGQERVVTFVPRSGNKG